MGNIISSIFNAQIGIIATILNIITSPFLNFIKDRIPSFDSYVVTVQSFINQYIFKGLQFSKMFFVNLTSINHGIFNIFIVSIGIFIAFTFLTYAIKLFYNIWLIVTGGKTN